MLLKEPAARGKRHRREGLQQTLALGLVRGASGAWLGQVGKVARSCQLRIILDPLTEVEANDGGLGTRRAEQADQSRQSLLGRQAVQALIGAAAALLLQGSSQADGGEATPLDTDGGQAQTHALVRQGIQEGVSRCVVGLPGSPQDRGCRRVQDEEVQLQVQRQPVQEPGTLHLGREGARKRLS